MPNLYLQQKQVLSALQVQSLSILTASMQDLVRIIEEHAEQNPLMILKRRKNILRDVRYVSKSAQEASDRYEEYLNSVPAKEDDLKQHFVKELAYLDLKPEEMEMCKLIVSNLDSRGFLIYDAQELLEIFDMDSKGKTELYHRMVDIISSIDPVGCAAMDVYDSLGKQLKALRPSFLQEGISEEMLDLAGEMLDEEDFKLFSKNRFSELASIHNADEDKVKRAFEIVRRLDPNPARDYSGSSFQYVIPTISVKIEHNEVHIAVKDDILPIIETDDTYDNANLDGEGRKFIDNCKKDISLLTSMIDSRNRSLSTIAYFMVGKQLNWLMGKSNSKHSLMLKDIARYSDISISTASRIVTSNYLQFEDRCMPLSDLMEKSADGSNSKSNVINAISDIIKSSPKKLSDESIRQILEKRGINISRRTVQKYRTLYLQQ